MKNTILSMAVAVALAGCGGSGTSTSTADIAQSQPVSASTSGDGGAQMNAIRAQAGLPALKRNAELERAALAHARDMAANTFMSHTGTDGSDLRTRVERTNYRWCSLAENVARGHSTDARAVESWRTSPGHYRNMTKTKAQHYGLANVNGFRVLVIGASRC